MYWGREKTHTKGDDRGIEYVSAEEIKPAHPKGDQPWIFIGRTDAEAEAPVL